jgi:putative flippase GtrA
MGFSMIRIWEIGRYYAAGIVNTAFGYGAFSALLWLGVNLYLSQLLAHIAGVTFNYITYSRHVFKNSKSTKKRFAASYAGNYLISLGTMALVDQIIVSQYVVGLLTIFLVSILNFFILKVVEKCTLQ